jgi:hypothetical protein
MRGGAVSRLVYRVGRADVMVMTEGVLPHGDGRVPLSGEGNAPSLHYVDGAGQPVNVRGWYRSWVIALAAISLISGYNAFLSGDRRSFAVGASEGISVAASCFAAVYLYAWWNDCRRSGQPRQYWARRNVRNARATVWFGGVLLLPVAVVLFTALRSGRGYFAGLSVGPVIAMTSLLALGVEVRQKQRAKGLG